MKKLSTLIAAALVIAVAVPAFAGEGYDCTADAQTCLDQMAAKMAKKGYMGLEFEKTADGQYMIKKVMEGAPAATAGFKPGDVVLAVNDTKWGDDEAMKKLDWGVGSKMTVKVQRNKEKKVLNITLAKMPEDVMARMVGQHMMQGHMAAATHEGHKH